MCKGWVAILLLVTLLAGCGRAATPLTTPLVTAPATESGSPRNSGGVSASGEIVPMHEAQLGFTIAGRVARVAVALGDNVQPDQELVALEMAALEAQVAQAAAALDAAQANLARLEAGARPEEIAASEAAVSLARAQVSQAEAAAKAADAQCAGAQSAVDAARAALEAAQAQARQLDTGPREATVAAAEAEVKLAQAQLQQAQAAYDRVKNTPEIQMRPEALALEQATITYQAAQDQYRALFQGTTKEEREAAAAQVETARAQVAQAGDQALATCAQAGQAAAAVEAAQAQQVQAEQGLALLKAGTAAAEIAAAEAQVVQNEAALQATRAALDQATLRAPFAGTITALEIEAGETATPGQALLVLADLSELRVETTDLSERDVTRVVLGQKASVYVEALGQELDGQVVGIAQQASTIGGDVVYAVFIHLSEKPPGLRWGMSADVEVATE